jgi:hypothetical protein
VLPIVPNFVDHLSTVVKDDRKQSRHRRETYGMMHEKQWICNVQVENKRKKQVHTVWRPFGTPDTVRGRIPRTSTTHITVIVFPLNILMYKNNNKQPYPPKET